MSSLNTILFGVGVFVFMLTIYGAVVAGGEALKHKQLEQLADDTEEVKTATGFELFVTPQQSNDRGRLNEAARSNRLVGE